MYPEGNYAQNRKEASYTNIYQRPNHFHSTTDVNNSSYEYQTPVLSRNGLNYPQTYKIYLGNNFNTENIKNNNNFGIYNTSINTPRRNHRNVRRIFYDYEVQPNPTLSRTNKYYYNSGVVIHERRNNNFHNNSIHFIKSTSKESNRKGNIEGNNNKVDTINTGRIPIMFPNYYSNNNSNVTNNINNYNIIKVDKNKVNYGGGRNNIQNNDQNVYKVNYGSGINNIQNNYQNVYNVNYGYGRSNIKNNVQNDYIRDNKNENRNYNYYSNLVNIKYPNYPCTGNINNINTPSKYTPNKSNRNITQNTKYIPNNINTKKNEIKEKEEEQRKKYIAQLINEKKNLEKKLNEIMNENRVLKKDNMNNKDLMNKNKKLTEKLNEIENKVKQLQIEKDNYLIEIDNHKNINNQNDIQINYINNKLKMAYLKFLIEKKMFQEKKNLKKYFSRYKDIIKNLKMIEEGDKNYEKFLDVVSTGIKSNDIYKQIEEDKKKEEEKKRKEQEVENINRRNKLLKKLVNNKIKDNESALHSNFNKFYYKGLINEMKNLKKSITNPEPKQDEKKEKNIPEEQQPKVENQENIEEPKQQEQPIEEQPKEEQPKEEQPKEEVPKEEEPKKKEEPKKEGEEEEQLTEEEIQRRKKERERINKINQKRRKQLKKLLEDEKKQKLHIKRMYFKKFHFRTYLFAKKNPENENEVNINQYLNENLESRKTEEKRKQEEKEKELQLQKEKDELMKKRVEKLKQIIYKIDRKSIIVLKNVFQKWNIRAKLMSLKEIKENDEKRKKRKSKGKSKKKKKENNSE